MTERIGEQGAAITAVTNPDTTVSGLGAAGYLQAAIADAIANGRDNASASRLGAQGRIYAIAGGGEISPGLSGGTAWSPSALFASSEVGVWYDPSVLSTMYQDSAGTIPVTAVGQPVGLMLDKSKGLVLGSELAPTDSMTNADKWVTVIGSATTAVVGNEIEITHLDTAYFAVDLELPASTAGRGYKLIATVRTNSGTAASTSIRCITMSSSPPSKNLSSVNTEFTSIGITTGTLLKVRLDSYANIAGQKLYISAISVKELPGYHALEATAAERPLLDTANLINYDGTDDLLTASNPDLGLDVTIARATAGGVSILTGQTVGANYVDNTDHYGLVIVNRALTAGETASLTAYLEGFIP